MNLFQSGEFTLHSGQKSDFKIDCDALTDDDIETCAYLLSRRIAEPFREVRGVPQGGLRLAKAMEKYAAAKGHLLIVDDVWTTGRSLMKFAGDATDEQVVGAVIFAREMDALDYIYALFVMEE